MIFEFDGGKPVDLKERFVTETFFVLRDGKPVPDVSIMGDIVLVMQGEMIENRFSKMRCARQKILREVLRDARHSRPFDRVFGRKHAVVRRNQMDIKLPIDQPANVMQNMCGRALRAGHDIEGGIEYARHGKIINEEILWNLFCAEAYYLQ